MNEINEEYYYLKLVLGEISVKMNEILYLYDNLLKQMQTSFTVDTEIYCYEELINNLDLLGVQKQEIDNYLIPKINNKI